MIIYKTTNLINSKMYIGLDSRNDPAYLGSGLLLQRAIKKYGRENFKKEIIEECKDEKHLRKREIYWIDFLNAVNSDEYYNLDGGGIGGKNEKAIKSMLKQRKGKTYEEIYGIKRARQIKKKISENNGKGMLGKTHTDKTKKYLAKNAKKIHTGRKRSDETKQNISKGILASNHSEIMKTPEMREKISKATKKVMKKIMSTDEWKRNHSDGMKGHKVSNECRNKISQSLKGKPKSEKHREALVEAWKRRKKDL